VKSVPVYWCERGVAGTSAAARFDSTFGTGCCVGCVKCQTDIVATLIVLQRLGGAICEQMSECQVAFVFTLSGKYKDFDIAHRIAFVHVGNAATVYDDGSGPTEAKSEVDERRVVSSVEVNDCESGVKTSDVERD